MNRKVLFNIIEYDDEHRSRWSTLYDVVMLVMIVISIVPLMVRKQTVAFDLMDRISVCFFIIDYLLRWFTADFKHNKRKPWQAFILHPFTPMAILDLLSILPGLHILGSGFKILRITRLLRILRLFKFIRYSDKIQVLVKVINKEKTILWTVFGVAVFYVFLTALIMFNAEPRINPNTGVATFETFFDALYWATVTLTTVGYGDVIPVTNIGRLISMISSLFGVAIIALPSGVITASYLDELRQNKREDK